MTGRLNVELVHGYTLTDLHEIARLSVHTAGMMATDWHERYDVAYSAIAEHLYAAPHWPQRYDLVRAGQLAINRVVRDLQQAHGYYRAHTDGGAHGPCSSPAFRAYWWDLCGLRNAQSPEPRIVEEHTVAAIWPMLSSRQQDALLALAALGDYRAAAAALGIQDQTYRALLGRARTLFRAYWHEGEEPSRQWGCDRRAGSKAGSRRAAGTAGDAIRRRAKANAS